MVALAFGVSNCYSCCIGAVVQCYLLIFRRRTISMTVKDYCRCVTTLRGNKQRSHAGRIRSRTETKTNTVHDRHANLYRVLHGAAPRRIRRHSPVLLLCQVVAQSD